MKGRFRILKSGVRLHGVVVADWIWLTCCALHNWLLEIDGLDEEWDCGAASDWEGELGELGISDLQKHVTVLEGQVVEQSYDTSGMGAGSDRDAASHNDLVTDVPLPTDDGAICVQSLPLKVFQKRLINHYDILYQQDKTVWPSRWHTT
jgi:hypothetical protein